MRTKEQKRSQYALQMLEEMFGVHVDPDPANFIVGVPTMVLTNGIGQTMAFLMFKKKEKKHLNVFKIIQGWLQQEIPELKTESNIDFLKKFSTLNQKEYLTAQQESLAMLQWLKRYARAFEKEKGV